MAACRCDGGVVVLTVIRGGPSGGSGGGGGGSSVPCQQCALCSTSQLQAWE
jgi:hypothetical protein